MEQDSRKNLLKDAEPVSASQDMAETIAPITSQNLIDAARNFLDTRAKCAPLLPKSLFRDSAWDMMLELFIATEQNERLCVKDLTSIAGESPTGTMRRIDRLEEAHLIYRRQDDIDHRRVHIELTARGRVAMVSTLRSLYDFSSIDTEDRPSCLPASFHPQRLDRPD